MTTPYLRGLDASSVQAAVPFWLLDPELRFAILKGQSGNDGFDPWFVKNVKAAMAEGREPFAYCFAYPLPHLDPKAQAKLFVERVHGAARVMEGRPLFLDYEWPAPDQFKRWGCTAQQISTWCEANAAEVERLSDVTPIIYTYPHWWATISKGVDVSWAAHYPLWLASYPKAVGWPTEDQGKKLKLPAPWKQWLFWQFDGNGGLKLPNGVDCDFCVFKGDEAALQALTGKGALTPPAAPLPDLSTVLGVQTRLKALGIDPGPLDGVNGPKTIAAVKVFQLSKGLVADGIVGPKTRAALVV